MSATVITGDALDVMRTLAPGSVRCCVTSPPYWGLRDYGTAGQLGLEPTPEEYVARLVEVFAEVRRVLTDDGTLWLNLGDSYSSGAMSGAVGPNSSTGHHRAQHEQKGMTRRASDIGLSPKNLVGIPWRVAFALQADGWYLRSDIIWAKPNPMPESVTDRPTKAHEYVFLLSKRERYYYAADAIAEETTDEEYRTVGKVQPTAEGGAGFEIRGGLHRQIGGRATRNARTVWTIATQPFKGAHFATFPEELARRCVLAGSAPGDVVLDPFGGSGTVGAVAVKWQRNAVLAELNPDYCELARRRIAEAEAQGNLFGAA